MKKLLFLLILFFALTPSMVSAETPLGYPGYSWGSLVYPSSLMETDNLLYDGKIEQGIDWAVFGKKKEYVLNTFADFRYTLDTAGYSWNNKIMPGVGTKIVRRLPNNIGAADIFVKYVYEYRWKDNEQKHGVQVGINYYFSWNLKKRGH